MNLMSSTVELIVLAHSANLPLATLIWQDDSGVHMDDTWFQESCPSPQADQDERIPNCWNIMRTKQTGIVYLQDSSNLIIAAT